MNPHDPATESENIKSNYDPKMMNVAEVEVPKKSLPGWIGKCRTKVHKEVTRKGT